MRYELLKDLPFLAEGDLLMTNGSWTGGSKWGVDKGTMGGAHNGVRVFDDVENKIIDTIIENKEWVRKILENKSDIIQFYGEELFCMVYQWGRNGIGVDFTSPAFCSVLEDMLLKAELLKEEK